MNKAMIFIDGTWLYKSHRVLTDEYGEKYKIDYAKLPDVVAGVLAKQMTREIDVVRTHFFCSIPDDVKSVDLPAVEEQQDFYEMLREECHYEVESFPIYFHGRRLRRKDRLAENPADDFEPREKCVDIALATSMLYYAAIPHAYDIAIAIVGDEDYRPVLQHVRRLGRRVAIATVKSKELAFQYRDPLDAARIRDFDPIFLNDHLGELQLKQERRQLECGSLHHKGARLVWTEERVRSGRDWFCGQCRAVEREARGRFETALQSQLTDLQKLDRSSFGDSVPGVITKLKESFGFIRADSGKDYFFHISAIEGAAWANLKESDTVLFDIENEPSLGEKSGKARRVRLYAATASV